MLEPEHLAAAPKCSMWTHLFQLMVKQPLEDCCHGCDDFGLGIFTLAQGCSVTDFALEQGVVKVLCRPLAISFPFQVDPEPHHRPARSSANL